MATISSSSPEIEIITNPQRSPSIEILTNVKSKSKQKSRRRTTTKLLSKPRSFYNSDDNFQLGGHKSVARIGNDNPDKSVTRIGNDKSILGVVEIGQYDDDDKHIVNEILQDLATKGFINGDFEVEIEKEDIEIIKHYRNNPGGDLPPEIELD